LADVVVTVPKSMWADWLLEGELPGQDRWDCFFCPPYAGDCRVCHGTGELTPSDTRWHFYLGGHAPKDAASGDRVYVVAHGRLRGYAPLLRIERDPEEDLYGPRFSFVRGGGAEALTIPDPIRGFQGWRYRWWERDDEVPFPDWQEAGVG
jgi:hypothetical protein